MNTKLTLLDILIDSKRPIIGFANVAYSIRSGVGVCMHSISKMYCEREKKRHHLSIQQRTTSHSTQHTTKYAEEAANATTTATALYNGGNR